MHDEEQIESGEKAAIILQSLICYLREKNILSRADIQELRERVELRVSGASTGPSCHPEQAKAAAREMRELDDFCGRKYGGKHRRV